MIFNSRKLTEDKVTELFCIADDFYKYFDTMMEKHTIKAPSKRKYHRDGTLSKALVLFLCTGSTVFTSILRHPVSRARARENFMFKGVRVS